MSRPEEALGYTTSRRTVSWLPDWARYLMRLGGYLVNQQVNGRRLVVGISLPTRAFAAAFAALGVAAAAYEDPEKRDPRENFDRLTSLPAGTSIRFRRGRYLYSGRLLGVETISGVERLVYHDGSAKCSLPWDQCGTVQLLDPAEEFVRRRPLAANAEFVQAVLEVDPFSHASCTSLDCLIVGVKDALRSEVLEEHFVACQDEIPQASGVLNDLLRCDAFELNANDHDRTSVISGFADDIPERLRSQRPPTVVFDGPAGYLRLRRHWRSSPWLVLLDRTSPSATAAADAFNQELALSSDDADLSALGQPPAEFEIRAYHETVR